MNVSNGQTDCWISILCMQLQCVSKSVMVLNLNAVTRKMLDRTIIVRCLLKAESCSYLMVYDRLKLNFFIKARGLQKYGVFAPFLVRFSLISSFYREYFTVAPIKSLSDC